MRVIGGNAIAAWRVLPRRIATGPERGRPGASPPRPTDAAFWEPAAVLRAAAILAHPRLRRTEFSPCRTTPGAGADRRRRPAGPRRASWMSMGVGTSGTARVDRRSTYRHGDLLMPVGQVRTPEAAEPRIMTPCGAKVSRRRRRRGSAGRRERQRDDGSRAVRASTIGVDDGLDDSRRRRADDGRRPTGSVDDRARPDRRVDDGLDDGRRPPGHDALDDRRRAGPTTSSTSGASTPSSTGSTARPVAGSRSGAGGEGAAGTSVGGAGSTIAPAGPATGGVIVTTATGSAARSTLISWAPSAAPIRPPRGSSDAVSTTSAGGVRTSSVTAAAAPPAFGVIGGHGRRGDDGQREREDPGDRHQPAGRDREERRQAGADGDRPDTPERREGAAQRRRPQPLVDDDELVVGGLARQRNRRGAPRWPPSSWRRRCPGPRPRGRAGWPRTPVADAEAACPWR